MNYLSFFILDSNRKVNGKFFSISQMARAPTPNLKVLRKLSRSQFMKYQFGSFEVRRHFLLRLLSNYERILSSAYIQSSRWKSRALIFIGYFLVPITNSLLVIQNALAIATCIIYLHNFSSKRLNSKNSSSSIVIILIFKAEQNSIFIYFDIYFKLVQSDRKWQMKRILRSSQINFISFMREASTYRNLGLFIIRDCRDFGEWKSFWKVCRVIQQNYSNSGSSLSLFSRYQSSYQSQMRLIRFFILSFCVSSTTVASNPFFNVALNNSTPNANPPILSSILSGSYSPKHLASTAPSLANYSMLRTPRTFFLLFRQSRILIVVEGLRFWRRGSSAYIFVGSGSRQSNRNQKGIVWREGFFRRDYQLKLRKLYPQFLRSSLVNSTTYSLVPHNNYTSFSFSINNLNANSINPTFQLLIQDRINFLKAPDLLGSGWVNILRTLSSILLSWNLAISEPMYTTIYTLFSRYDCYRIR